MITYKLYDVKNNKIYSGFEDSPCLIISNSNSGKANKPTPEVLMSYFDLLRPFEVFDGSQDISEFRDIIVSGGDGTISTTVNLCKNSEHNVYYSPSGTVNDFASIKSKSSTHILGKVNETRFCYVFAAGTLTSIGYTTKQKLKTKIGKSAYVLEAIKCFKKQKISALISTKEREFKGDFTLIMILRSPRCFGFDFNKIFDFDKNELYLLLVKTPKNRLELFIKFFRIFFLGFRRPYSKNGIEFLAVDSLKVELGESVSFCLDGDKYVAPQKLTIEPIRFNGKIITKKR